jgi:hypothetical protein
MLQPLHNFKGYYGKVMQYVAELRYLDTTSAPVPEQRDLERISGCDAAKKNVVQKRYL